MRTSTAIPIPAFLADGIGDAATSRKAKSSSWRPVEVFVNKIAQLFNSMDPAPFYEKDLGSEAEEFSVLRLQEFGPHERVSLLVHVNENPKHEDLQQIIEMAVHNHFLYCAKLKRLRASDRCLTELNLAVVKVGF